MEGTRKGKNTNILVRQAHTILFLNRKDRLEDAAGALLDPALISTM